MDLANFWNGPSGYQIERSLRFNSADSAYLSKTPTTPTNNLKWTFSCWVKRSALGASSALFDAYLNGINFSTFYFTSTNELQFYNILGGVDTGVTTTGVYRDLSAWYHIVFVFDSANATAADRAIIYVNGTRPAQTNPYGAVTPSEGTYLNNPYAHSIGRMVDSGTYLNGYLTETYLIDGQALTPSSFGETDTITGVWKPKRYAGTYGTNGFYLKFADNSGTTSTTLGKDSSGNGNNWTPNNFSVTAGAGNDSIIDTPTPYADGGNGRGNYCTLNPLILIPRGTISNGNLNYLSGSTASHGSAAASFTLPTTGKWYWEVTACANSGGSGNNESIGVANIQNNPQLPASGSEIGSRSGDYVYRSSAARVSGGSSVSYGATYTNGDVIGVAWDSDAGTLVFYKNGSSQGTAYSSITQEAGKYAPASSNAESSNGDDFNFGQRPFAYTPPSGFLALNTQNLPEPSIKKPSSYMDVKLYTGTSASQTISGLGFSPDLVWVKRRSNSANSHALFDAVRGAGYRLSSNETTAEVNNTANFTAFTSDGFSVASNGGETNLSPETYVAWCWDESATPGFDIVTYTGNGTSQNISHNLGVAPSMVIVKQRIVNGGGPYHWHVWHSALGANEYLLLSATNAKATDTTTWNNTAPTSTVFSVGSYSATNLNNNQFVAYLWSEVAGFSKFGSYTGNGSSDGPFLYCGFQPKFLLIKSSSSGYDWFIFDDARNTYNAVDLALFPNVSGAESGGSTYLIDFTSNGFKLRNTQLNLNGSGNTYIFAAWAEFPAKYSLAR